MDKQEARIVLQCYRPGIDDPTSAPFAEALRLAESDPELARLWKEHSELDRAIRSKLKELPDPVELKQRILTGPPHKHRAFWTTSRIGLAVAAAVVFVLLLIGPMLDHEPNGEFAAWREEMVAFVAQDYKLDFETSDMDDVRRTLVAMNYPSRYELPAGLSHYELEGGCARKWKTHNVTLLCYEGEKDVWLYVVDRVAFPDAPLGQEPVFAQVGELNTYAWTKGNLVYLLTSRLEPGVLQKILAP